jgi:hypothetical protein
MPRVLAPCGDWTVYKARAEIGGADQSLKAGRLRREVQSPAKAKLTPPDLGWDKVRDRTLTTGIIQLWPLTEC